MNNKKQNKMDINESIARMKELLEISKGFSRLFSRRRKVLDRD